MTKMTQDFSSFRLAVLNINEGLSNGMVALDLGCGF